MASKTPPLPSETTLKIKRTFAAPLEKVFRAWTDPKELTRWFAPSDDYSTPLAEVDLRVGGTYRIQMKAADGVTYTVKGAYREVRPPERLVFTWAWEGESCAGRGLTEFYDTLVTLEFRTIPEGTEMTLTHEYFLSKDERAKHSEGWAGCLNRLSKVL